MHFSFQFFLYTFLTLFSPFPPTNSAPSTHVRPTIQRTIDVDHSGKGHFTTIQAAIDSVPAPNNHWTCIRIKKGVYREQVSIRKEKPFIFLKGEGRKNTHIVYDANDTTLTSATFSSYANNTIAKGISFFNSYNNGTRNIMKAAVAAKIEGDKSSFYECGFYGMQDTLWDASGRHFFKQCSIQGGVDFIFGSGQSLYEKCTISVLKNLNKVAGYITAQGRRDERETNGFVFKECDILGKGKVYLGRAWGNHSKVLFFNSSMADIIVPQGWDPWSSAGHEKNLTFAEHECRGKGSNTSKRVKWEKKLSERELKQLTSISFIDNEGWLNNQISVD